MFAVHACLGGLLGALVLTTGCKPRAVVAAPPPPADVVVTQVAQRDEPIYSEWVGSLDGLVNAQIRAQVSGYLLKQDYTEGTSVKKGDLLFQIDDRTFQAAYAQAKANFDRAESEMKRIVELSGKNVVAAQDRDNAIQAQLAAKAALDQAQLNLEFTRIISPIDGIAGIATAQIGDLVGPGSGVLTAVSTVDPIKAYFSISEQSYLAFKQPRPGQPKFPEEFELQLIMADGTVYPFKGKVFATDRQIDAGTGTMRLAGVFPNPDLLLRPGQYARIRAAVRIEKNALLVPQRAVNELQGTYQVSTVDADNKAHVRTVKVGERVGSDWIITQGLQPGERVIVEGTQKVKEGSPVNPHVASAGS